MYKGFLDNCIRSLSMREYLKTQEISAWRAVDIIIGAPVPVETKIAELTRLSKESDVMADKDGKREVEEALAFYEKAMRDLETAGIFSVEINDFDHHAKEIRENFETICGSFEAVKEYIRNEEATYLPDAEECRWYDVKKWELSENGKYENICEYYMYRESIMYVDSENSGYLFAGAGGDLNLPVPFKAGDLLEVDGFPFGPKFRMLILSIGDNADCCCVQGLAMDENGLWHYGAVKHGMVSFSYFPKVAYLYSADHFTGELPADEQILSEVKAYIGEDQSKGDELWDRLSCEMTDDELRKLIQK